MPTLKIATCQFAVGASVARNAAAIARLMTRAAEAGADIAHFSECALSGYAGSDFESWDGYDWDVLPAAAEQVCRQAKALGLWVVLGSSHPLTGDHLPHNSTYVIDARGEIVDRYDKRFCTGGDLKYYSPGKHFAVVDVKGVRCGFLICYDVRFPELYRAYKGLGVECMFHSFYNARAARANIHTTIMRASLQARAASNYIWVSGNNSSAYYQSWQSVFIQPDGVIAASLSRHKAGLMINQVDTDKELYDASGAGRQAAMNGILNSGETVDDPRGRNRRNV